MTSGVTGVEGTVSAGGVTFTGGSEGVVTVRLGAVGSKVTTPGTLTLGSCASVESTLVAVTIASATITATPMRTPEPLNLLRTCLTSASRQALWKFPGTTPRTRTDFPVAVALNHSVGEDRPFSVRTDPCGLERRG